MKQNPFNVLYGMIPNSLIRRNDAYDQILNSFLDAGTIAMSYMILGIRGSGKTVLMRSVAKELKQKEDWVVIDLNPQGDFVSPLAEGLFLATKKLRINLGLSIDLGIPHITFHLETNSTTLSSEMAIRRMLDGLKKKGKRVLVTIDEIHVTKKLNYFANFYQSLIGDEFPVFLLMTGLIENVDSLISGKSTSFLARSPKVCLNPLDLPSISRSYQKELNISGNDADELAKLTNGYAFAYQVIGSLCFSSGECRVTPELLDKLDTYLAENGYGVIWNGMTQKEKDLCVAISECPTNETSAIREASGMSLNNFNNYRLQMIRKGYLVSAGYGKIEFALPRFKEYVTHVRNFF